MFAGRMNRLPYLFNYVPLMGVTVLLGGRMLGSISLLGQVMLLPGLLVLFVIWLSCQVRRCHDLDWPWWAILVMMLPVLGQLFSLVLLFLPGDDGPNQYGADPRQAPAPKPQATRGLCAAHGLAQSGPEGCVRCRRASDLRASWLVLATAGTAIFAMGAAATHRALMIPAVRRAPARAQAGSATIVVYGANWCGACSEAKAWLDSNGFAYSYRNIEEPGVTEELVAAAKLPPGAIGIPVIGINGVYQSGFDPDELQRTLGGH